MVASVTQIKSGITINADASTDAKTIPTNFIVCKIKNICILLTFLSISIALLIAVSTYYYLIKYQAKQKHSLSFHVTNNKLK